MLWDMKHALFFMKAIELNGSYAGLNKFHVCALSIIYMEKEAGIQTIVCKGMRHEKKMRQSRWIKENKTRMKGQTFTK